MIVRGIALSKDWKSMGSPVPFCEVKTEGIFGDIHFAGRKSPVSILPFEKVEKFFEEAGHPWWCGRFGENLLVEDLPFEEIKMGNRFQIGEVILEVEKVGAGGEKSKAYKGFKVCSPMEEYFVFCRVLQGGRITPQQRVFMHR